MRTINKKTEDIHIHVKPLPAAPPGFSGAVGKITLSTSLPTDLLQGSQVVLSVRIGGQGNPASISAPDLTTLDWAHVSTPTADPDNSAQSGLLKVFNYNLTPLVEGPHELPEMKIIYFSPESGKYETAGAPKLEVNVRKAVESMQIQNEDKILKVTVSIGSATYPFDAQDKQELIDNADKAMYASKQGGRNRVSFFSQVRNTPAGIAPQPH